MHPCRKTLNLRVRARLVIACLMPLAQIWIAAVCAHATAPPPNSGAASVQSAPATPIATGPASWSNWLASNVVLGALELGPFILEPTLNLQLDGFSEVNNGWGGRHEPPIQNSEHFFEQSNEEGLNGRFDADRFGVLSGRISGIFDMVGGGLNAAATNQGQIQNDNYSIEDAYLKWSSGEMFPLLGYDAIQIIGGRYTYRIGDGFLFHNGASGGGNRVAAWMAPHHDFAQSSILRLHSHDVLVEGFYLSPNDHPSTGTRLAGVNLEYRFTELLSTGFTYANIFHSDTSTRQGLNLIYWRAEGSPLAAIEDFYLSCSIALETNGNRVNDALAWFITPSYTFSTLRWQPTLYYRYATFSGGGTRGNKEFDPLFYGMSDWGVWYQGDILGNWFISNTNLNSHQVRLNFTLDAIFGVNLIYYHFLLDSRQPVSMPRVTSKNLSDEVDLDIDFSVTKWWTMAIMIGANVPEIAARELTRGNQTWFQSGLWSSWTF